MTEPVTILDIAILWGAKADAEGSINGGEFDRLGLPLFAGCQCCHATLAAYNAFPTRNGWISCRECVEDTGFATVADFDVWNDQDEGC